LQALQKLQNSFPDFLWGQIIRVNVEIGVLVGVA
jgi:hypothetical protein